MTTRVSIAAHAKLNLWLRVIAKEATGYHSIETLFHRIELHDDVIVSLTADQSRGIDCSEDVGPASDNLAYRAAGLYCDAVGWQTGFRIEIIKRIPAGGGLGGGSADAAATLVALDSLSPSAVGEDRLREIGARLGADVPFLVSGAVAALAWGRGDRIVPVPALPQRHVALVVPAFGISTAEAYGSLPAREQRASAQMAPYEARDWAAVARSAGNDLAESAVVRRRAEIARAALALHGANASIAAMTGSGSVVFGIFESAPDRGSPEAATGCRVILTRTSLNIEGPTRLD